MMIPWKEGGREEGEERKGYIHINSTDGPILFAGVVSTRQHALLYVLVHIIHAHIRVRSYTYTSAFPHEGTYTFAEYIHICIIYRVGPLLSAVLFLGDNTRCCYMLVHVIHALTRVRTLCTCARAHPRKNAHAQHMTYSSAHAQARMRSGTCGLTTHAHTPPRMNTRAYMRTHTRYARMQAHSCTHPHNANACIRTRMREHTSTCARTRETTCIFGCALTDWGHTP